MNRYGVIHWDMGILPLPTFLKELIFLYQLIISHQLWWCHGSLSSFYVGIFHWLNFVQICADNHCYSEFTCATCHVYPEDRISNYSPSSSFDILSIFLFPHAFWWVNGDIDAPSIAQHPKSLILNALNNNAFLN